MFFVDVRKQNAAFKERTLYVCTLSNRQTGLNEIVLCPHLCSVHVVYNLL